MKKHQTNVEFIVNLMDFSSQGALMQAFVLEGLRLYSEQVLADKSVWSEDFFIGQSAWKGCAEEALAKLASRSS